MISWKPDRHNTQYNISDKVLDIIQIRMVRYWYSGMLTLGTLYIVAS